MVRLSAIRCSCISILWVSLVSFAAITFCVASKRVFLVIVVYFFIGSVRELLDTPSYIWLWRNRDDFRFNFSQIARILNKNCFHLLPLSWGVGLRWVPAMFTLRSDAISNGHKYEYFQFRIAVLQVSEEYQTFSNVYLWYVKRNDSINTEFSSLINENWLLSTLHYTDTKNKRMRKSVLPILLLRRN
jgi:hypothetical protein